MYIYLFLKVLPYLSVYPYIWTDDCTAREICHCLYIWFYYYPVMPIPIYPLIWIYVYLIDAYLYS